MLDIHRFLEEAQLYTASIENGDEGHMLQRRLESVHVAGWHCTACGTDTDSHLFCQCNHYRKPRLEAIPSARAHWLAAPRGFSEHFISAPYGRGESVPAANRRVLEFECGDMSWEFFAFYGHTTGGGAIIFDPQDEALVALLAEFRASLEDYLILDDEAHFEVEREMWEEAVESYLRSDFIREVERSDVWGSIDGSISSDIIWSTPYLEDLVDAILWGGSGDYSADDIWFDTRAADAFAQGLKKLVLIENWDEIPPSLEEIAEGVERREFHFSGIYADSYVEPEAARKMAANMRGVE